MLNDRVIENGTELEFLNGIEGRLTGIVNGSPLIGWNDSTHVVTYLPVWVASVKENMYVDAANVTRVVETVA